MNAMIKMIYEGQQYELNSINKEDIKNYSPDRVVYHNGTFYHMWCSTEHRDKKGITVYPTSRYARVNDLYQVEQYILLKGLGEPGVFLCEDGFYGREQSIRGAYWPETMDTLVQREQYAISAVRRFSDDVLFELGDTIGTNGFNGTIIKFVEIPNTDIIIYIETNDTYGRNTVRIQNARIIKKKQ